MVEAENDPIELSQLFPGKITFINQKQTMGMGRKTPVKP
jgi:hypothetical protein